MDFVSRFATDTRHKQHLEPDTNTTIKKLLATQAPVVDDFTRVYPYVSDDLQRIEFRAPNQLQRYRDGVVLEPGVLKSLIGKLKEGEHYSIFQDYCNHVLPSVTDERQKLIAFFLHGQKHKNLHELIESELDGPVDKRLYDRIQSYKPSKGLSEMEIAREVGMMIADMAHDSPDLEYEQVDCHFNPEDETAKIEDEGEGEDDEEVAAKTIAPPTEFTAEHERALRNNPVMQAFKRDNRLPNQFPSVKVAKQILLSNLAPVNEHMRPLLGKKQTLSNFRLHALLPDQKDGQDTWTSLVSIVDHMDTAAIQSMLNTQQVRTFNSCCNHGIEEGRQLIKEVLAIHAQMPNRVDGPAAKRYMRRVKDQGLGSDLIKLIVEN